MSSTSRPTAASSSRQASCRLPSLCRALPSSTLGSINAMLVNYEASQTLYIRTIPPPLVERLARPRCC